MTRAKRRKNLELLLVHGGLKQVGCCIGRHKARFHKQRPRPKANRSPRGRWLRECSVHFARALSYQPSCARAKSEPDQVTFHQDLVAAVYRDLANASHLSIPGGRHAVPRNHDTFREPRPRQPVARARAALLSCRRWQLQGRLPSHRAAAEKFGEKSGQLASHVHLGGFSSQEQACWSQKAAWWSEEVASCTACAAAGAASSGRSWARVIHGRLPVIGRQDGAILRHDPPPAHARGRVAVGGAEAWPRVHPGVVRGARAAAGL